MPFAGNMAAERDSLASMPDPRALESLIESLRPDFEVLKEQAEQARPDVRMGCGLGIAAPVLASFVVAAVPLPWWARIVLVLGGIAAAIVGIPRLIRFAGKASQLKQPFQERILDPFVSLLMPGAVLERGRVSMDDWNRSRLFAMGTLGSRESRRLRGTIAGLPATLDETSWVREGMHKSFSGWIVRFELPFAVAGHLRIRRRGGERVLLTDGFEILPEASARLGQEYAVDVGPLEGDPLAGIVPTALVTGDVLEWSRTDPMTQVAVAGHALWVVTDHDDDAFPDQVVNFDLETFRRASQRFERAEAIARCVLAAGGARL